MSFKGSCYMNASYVLHENCVSPKALDSYGEEGKGKPLLLNYQLYFTLSGAHKGWKLSSYFEIIKK